MLDTIRETMAALRLEAGGYSEGVQIWMKVMSVAFLSAVIFAPWKAGARWILLAMVINIAGLIILKSIDPTLTRSAIGTSIHLAFWTIAIWAIWRPAARAVRRADQGSVFNRVYSIWLIVASAIMVASIILDARTFIGWFI